MNKKGRGEKKERFRRVTDWKLYTETEKVSGVSASMTNGAYASALKTAMPFAKEVHARLVA